MRGPRGGGGGGEGEGQRESKKIKDRRGGLPRFWEEACGGFELRHEPYVGHTGEISRGGGGCQDGCVLCRMSHACEPVSVDPWSRCPSPVSAPTSDRCLCPLTAASAPALPGTCSGALAEGRPEEDGRRAGGAHGGGAGAGPPMCASATCLQRRTHAHIRAHARAHTHKHTYTHSGR